MKWLLVQLFLFIKQSILDLFKEFEQQELKKQIKLEEERLNELKSKNNVIDSDLDNQLSNYRSKQGSGKSDV